MRSELFAASALALLLSACNQGGTQPVKTTKVITPPPSPASVRRPVRSKLPPPAKVQALPGLETVIGSTAADLTRQFGPARLDVREGDARKLQYAGTACVLDVYLYPPAAGREPQATYVDARRSSDGKDVDRVACIGSLKKP
jgi:hypothetical protein